MGGAADVDVVVIGGGLAGTAVLRELAQRGASTVLVERVDLGAGGSIAAHGTIDTLDLGLEGPRDPAGASMRARREREAAILLATAPHLVTRIPVLSISTGARRGARLLARWDALLALRARAGQPIDREVLDAGAARAREAALALDDERAALLTTRVRFDALRLALAFARDAKELGAELRLGEEVVSLTVEASAVRLVLRASRTRAQTELSARAVVVATGAWPMPGASAKRPRERRVHLVLEHAITTHAIVTDELSVVPFHNATLVSGNAHAFEGGAEDTRASREEVRALLARASRHVPDLREARVNAAYASVRRRADAADAAAPPVYVLPSGTPWEVRARAEGLGTQIAKELGLEGASTTATSRVPGGEEIVDSFVVAERLAIPEPTARRLVVRHGARFVDLGARVARRRTEAAVVCACDPVLEAEVRHAVRVEHARDVSDVGRRTCLGLGACGGMRCAHRAAELVCAERALPPHEAHEMARRFLAERWRARAPALDATALAQEELAHARWTSAHAIAESDADAAESGDAE